MDNRFARITAAAGRRPLLTLALAALLSFAGALAALTGLQASTSTDTLVDKGSSSYDATNKYRTLFGGDPVVIMAKGDLRHTVETSDLGRLLQLEGASEQARERGELAGLRPVHARRPAAGAEVRLHRAAVAGQRRLRRQPGLRLVAGHVHAKGALRLPVPELQGRADPGAAQA